MTKDERIEVAKKVCKCYKTNEFTIASCCENNGVKYRTFVNWIDKDSKQYNTHIAQLYKKAQDTKRQNNNFTLVRLARTALMKKLAFFKYDEVTTTTKGDYTETKTISKIVIPTATDIALALNNLDIDFKQIGEDENPEDIAEQFAKIAEQMRKNDGGQDEREQV